MAHKRKRQLEDFDVNKSDSEDENFDPTDNPAPRRSSKKSRSARASKPGKKRSGRYRGSDIDDDDEDVLDDSEEVSYDEDASESEDEDAPKNAAGRRARKAAVSHANYAESEDEEDEEVVATSGDDVKNEDDEVDEPVRPRGRKIVKLKVPQTATRRSTRATTADADDLVELSNSGNHAVPSRDSKSHSPEAFARGRRSSRSSKSTKAPPETIDEATQESSARPTQELDEMDEPDELSQDNDAMDEDTKLSGAVQDADPANPVGTASDEAKVNDEKAENDDDDEDDDVPFTLGSRRQRASRNASASAAEEGQSDVAAEGRPQRRLTRGRQKKSTQEPSSDFEPGDDSDDAPMSASDKGERDDLANSPSSRGRPRGRRGRSSKPRGGDDSADDEPEVDLDELNEEARELRQGSRPRRRRVHSPIVYQESSRRARNQVNYYVPPLNAAAIEEDDGPEPISTPARNRRGRAAVGWERNLNTTFGPFGGGGGAGSLLNGPWGTGAAGGVDSDSSDDEMVHRSALAGNPGMTPTSAAGPSGGLLPGGAGLGMGGGGEVVNVGKIKDRKALADADPLGVDVNVDFSKVGGLQGHIDQLKEMVQLPLLYPELFTKFHVTPPRGVLFHGPPGTGKTLLARALANSIGSGGKKISFYMRKGADALSKWVGEAEKQLRLLFEEARKTQPSIIFFDEIDGLAPVRSSKQEQIHASIVSTLLALMDGMDGRGQVIVIGATNRPDNIDPALRRPGRFDREFYFPLPDLEARKSILSIHTKDWGLSDNFMNSLADKTKGYGGADLRALCTEAALNSIQRTYPQIYASQEKLIVKPENISVHATDFMISIKKLIPSSERSATSGAQPLPRPIEPLLRDQLTKAKEALDRLLPRKKKLTALQEAMYEQHDDEDHGFGREVMNQEFERSRVFRPRLIIHGVHGMGQGYISSAILHYLEGVHVQNFDLPSILADGRAMEQVIVGMFTEVRRHKPSVIYIPNIDAWYASLNGTLALITFRTMLRSIQPTDPVLLLATAEGEQSDLDAGIFRDFFGLSSANRFEITRPKSHNRHEYFASTLEHIKKKPAEFPDPENRKKRVLEELPVAPPPAAQAPTKAETKALKKRDHQLLNGLKVQLQPIMDQINRKYKKFRQPVIPQAQIDYLFAETDPNYVQPDVEAAIMRPYEIVKDKYDNDVLRDHEGKTFYNLETTTIEERLSNGFYTRPKDFLFDIKALAKDAKNIGDKERTLKANELLSNVEVDVASIETSTAHVDWEALYQRQRQRAKDQAEKERKKKAMQSIVDRVQSDLGGGNDSDSQGPVMLGEQVPGQRTTARFQIRSPAAEDGAPSATSGPNNGLEAAAAGEADVQMSGVDDTQRSKVSDMAPPPKARDAATSTAANDVSITKSSERSSGSQWTSNGHHQDQSSVEHDDDVDIPDTLRDSQIAPNDEVWPHSQVHALHRDQAQPHQISTLAISPTSSQNRSSGVSGTSGVSKPHGMSAILNDPAQEEASPLRNSGSSSSQPYSVDGGVVALLRDITRLTSGCTVEQLEQINRDLMDEIWRTRHEWNRNQALSRVSAVFNATMRDIEELQGMEPFSQKSSGEREENSPPQY